jgi:ADP-heptose:LPS heptosyltransferase
MKSIFKKIRDGLAWRWRLLRPTVDRFLLAFGLEFWIVAHWPPPFRKPWQRRKLLIQVEGGGLGDQLMCTPILREIKRRNPRCEISVITRYPFIFSGNENVSRILVEGQSTTESPVILRYDQELPPELPLITMMAACAGLYLPDPQRLQEPVLSFPEALWSTVRALPKPWIIIQTMASKWTPNKSWPAAYWEELVIHLLELGTVIDTGVESQLVVAERGEKFFSLVGRTSPEGFAWLIKEADLFIGPSSGGMHFASAFGIPSVIIFGGYESDKCYSLPMAQAFFTPVECAPCWLTSPCPHDKKCLKAISPRSVFEAAVERLTARRQGSRSEGEVML